MISVLPGLLADGALKFHGIIRFDGNQVVMVAFFSPAALGDKAHDWIVF
jgi:hypothetical protein